MKVKEMSLKMMRMTMLIADKRKIHRAMKDGLIGDDDDGDGENWFV